MVYVVGNARGVSGDIADAPAGRRVRRAAVHAGDHIPVGVLQRVTTEHGRTVVLRKHHADIRVQEMRSVLVQWIEEC